MFNCLSAVSAQSHFLLIPALFCTFGPVQHLFAQSSVFCTFLHYWLVSTLFFTIFHIKNSIKVGKLWYCELESFGTVSWKVMEPIWKVLVLGVGKYWNRSGKFWYHDIRPEKCNLEGDWQHACSLPFFRHAHFETTATCLLIETSIW